MNSSTPVYRVIADQLRARIDSGELAPGAQVPTQHELEAEFGVARMTVRQALKVLENEGLIVSRRPVGLFVRERRRMKYQPQAEFRRPTSEVMDRFMAAVTDEGREPSQAIGVSLVAASVEVAKRLDIPAGTTVVARKRVRYIDGEPFNINDSYYPLELVKDSEIMSPDDVARGTNQVLVDLGHYQVRAIDEIHVRMPSPEQVSRLDLLPGTPVALHICTGYTADDRPVRCTVNVLPGDRHVILYERTRPVDSASSKPAATAAATWG